MTDRDHGTPMDPFADLPESGLPDERLADYVDERLSTRDRERFEAELRVSPTLREQLREYQATVDVLRNALNAPIRSTDLADRVMATLASEAKQSSRAIRSFWPIACVVASAAALLTVAIWVDSWGRVPTKLASNAAAVNADDESRRERDGQWDQPSGDRIGGEGAPHDEDSEIEGEVAGGAGTASTLARPPSREPGANKKVAEARDESQAPVVDPAAQPSVAPADSQASHGEGDREVAKLGSIANAPEPSAEDELKREEALVLQRSREVAPPAAAAVQSDVTKSKKRSSPTRQLDKRDQPAATQRAPAVRSTADSAKPTAKPKRLANSAEPMAKDRAARVEESAPSGPGAGGPATGGVGPGGPPAGPKLGGRAGGPGSPSVRRRRLVSPKGNADDFEQGVDKRIDQQRTEKQRTEQQRTEQRRAEQPEEGPAEDGQSGDGRLGRGGGRPRALSDPAKGAAGKASSRRLALRLADDDQRGKRGRAGGERVGVVVLECVAEPAPVSKEDPDAGTPKPLGQSPSERARRKESKSRAAPRTARSFFGREVRANVAVSTDVLKLGALTLTPLPGVVRSDRVRQSDWLIEGADADVRRLLGELARFAAADKQRRQRITEAKLIDEREPGVRKSAKGDEPASAADAKPSDGAMPPARVGTRRVVLRFLVRPE